MTDHYRFRQGQNVLLTHENVSYVRVKFLKNYKKRVFHPSDYSTSPLPRNSFDLFRTLDLFTRSVTITDGRDL